MEGNSIKQEGALKNRNKRFRADEIFFSLDLDRWVSGFDHDS